MDSSSPMRGLAIGTLMFALVVGAALALTPGAPSPDVSGDPLQRNEETARLWTRELLATAQHMRDIAASADPVASGKAVEALHESTKKRARYMHELQQSIDTPEAAAAMRGVFDARVIFSGPEHDILRRGRAGATGGVQQILVEDALPAHVAYLEKLVRLADILRARRTEAQAQAALQYSYARNAAFGLLVLASGLCALLAVALYRLRPRRDTWELHPWAAI
jgi:hypothetical protein